MGRQRHKRKKHQMMILASDSVDTGIEQYRYHPWLFRVTVLLLCIVIGAGIGFVYFEQDVLAEKNREIKVWLEQVESLEQEKAALENEVDSLNETIQILSDTINQKTQNENELSEQLQKQTTPTEFPLTGSATMEEVTEGNPMCIFTATDGAMVVATAAGTVTAVNDDSEYGHNIWVDHGNGYVTIYRNSGEIKVKQGETVTQGTTLFLVGEENSKLGYQMLKDGVYINPMEMLTISG
ncbi:MAG: peptidoglycan DD-metalloendopeptidase family protein [Lachnospiraceae bacterium]|nr:peptidoglycan DD-metalloendopeptidase family protein [Lachnospiraceae bacterium]